MDLHIKQQARPRFGLSVLRFVLGLVVGGYSVDLLLRQPSGKPHLPLLILAIAELLAAVIFLLPKTVRMGGVALIVVFALAACFHILHGEYNVGSLLVYGAAAWAVIANQERA